MDGGGGGGGVGAPCDGICTAARPTSASGSPGLRSCRRHLVRHSARRPASARDRGVAAAAVGAADATLRPRRHHRRTVGSLACRRRRRRLRTCSGAAKAPAHGCAAAAHKHRVNLAGTRQRTAVKRRAPCRSRRARRAPPPPPPPTHSSRRASPRRRRRETASSEVGRAAAPPRGCFRDCRRSDAEETCGLGRRRRATAVLAAEPRAPPSARAAVPTAAVTAEAIAALAAEDDERYERAVSKESTRPPSPPRSAAGELSRW